MIRSLTIALVGALTLGAGGGKPAETHQAGYESVPKYGDPTYQTIWSKTPGAERSRASAFSRDAARRGWQYLQQGDLETAIRRFNQSWSMDPENRSALWGMAIVQYSRSRQVGDASPTPRQLDLVGQAVSLIEEAASKPAPEPSLLNDNAMILITRGAMRKALSAKGFDSDFERAEGLLRRAEAKGPHPLIYENWASLEGHRGHAELAKQYDARARQMREGGQASP